MAGAAFTWGAIASMPAEAAVDGPKVTWKFNVWGKKRAFTADVEAWAKHVKDETNGKFKIKIFYGDQLGGKKQNLDNLKAGVFDAAKVCWSYHPGKNQSMTVLNLPFLPVKNFDVQRKVAEAIHKHPISSKEVKDKWNVFAFSSSQLPQYEFLGRGEVPTKLSAWKGMTVRSLGGLADAMRKLGSSISTMTATEVYQALDRGAADAVSFPSTYAHSAYKIDEVAEWFTSNLAPGTNDCPNVISYASWNKLPDQYKKLMNQAKEKGYAALKAAYSAKDKVNLPKWRKHLKEVSYTDAELAQFRKVGGQPVYDDWVNKNKDKFDSKALLDAVFAAAKSGS
ncbi:MAG: TRAP transporter substrate-binding protein DctP [Magnetovibrio sp.]|nr:TRAP transporter substrate-binding protein DctP [Magnetovibrio sp.]